MELNQAENKVRKLMKLAKDGAATAQEVETALRQAESLIQKHQIKLSELMSESDAPQNFNWGDKFVPYGRYGKTTWEASIVPTWFSVLAMGVAVFTDRTAKIHRRAVLGIGVGFYGEEQDVEFAVWLLEYLRDQVFYQARAEKGLGRADKELFRRGMVGRLQKRMYDLRANREEQLKTTGTCLVMVNNKIAQRNEKFGDNVGRKTTMANRQSSAFGAGVVAGNNVQFNRPIGG